MIKKYFHQKGLTLIEVIIAISLFSLMMTAFLSYFSFNMVACNKQINTLHIEQNIRHVVNYIEKNIRTFNQKEITYDSERQRIKGKDAYGNESWIDLSGKRQKQNCVLYYYKELKELRTNKRGEHNVLGRKVKDIKVREIIHKKLIEIEIFSEEIDYSVRMEIKLSGR